MTDVAQIVAGLTKAQHTVLRELKPGWKHRGIRFSGSCATRLAMRTKDRPALVSKTLTMGGRIAWYGLNEDGLAVRTALLSKEGESADA